MDHFFLFREMYLALCQNLQQPSPPQLPTLPLLPSDYLQVSPQSCHCFSPFLWPECQQPLKTNVPAPPGTLSSQPCAMLQASGTHHERGKAASIYERAQQQLPERASSRRGTQLRALGNRRPVHALRQVHWLRGSELIHNCKSKACCPTLCSKGQVTLKGSLSVLMGVQEGLPGSQNREVWGSHGKT